MMAPTKPRREAAGGIAPPKPRGLAARLLGRWTDPQPPGIRFGAGEGRYYRDTAYAGASRIRKQLANWQPMRAPADADLLPDQDLLVARSRDLDRNNGVAAGAFQTRCKTIPGDSAYRPAPYPQHPTTGRSGAILNFGPKPGRATWRACGAPGRDLRVRYGWKN